MAARFCDGACKCAECSHYKNDKEKHGKACFAVPDSTGIVHADKKNRNYLHKHRQNRNDRGYLPNEGKDLLLSAEE